MNYSKIISYNPIVLLSLIISSFLPTITLLDMLSTQKTIIDFRRLLYNKE
jgi:hypothetical protein